MVAVSVRGLQLRAMRYGPDTDRLVEEALAREYWTQVQWRQWQEERLSRILHRARFHVPFYRLQWENAASAGRHHSYERLEHWPILEKEQVRSAPRQFLADDCSLFRMIHEQTSGTSGTPLDLWWSRITLRQWYALFEARWRRWYGVSRNDRWGILGGQLVVPLTRRRPPFWVWNAPFKQLYLSSYHLSPSLIPAYLSAITRYGVEYLYGYTSALYALAEETLRLKRRLPLRVVVTNAEPVYSYQREAIREAFGCPVRETYGMSEIVAAGGECSEGRLHLWPEVGLLEVQGDQLEDSTVKGDRLIATGLFNPDMPLIRYAVGDRVTLPVSEATCPCGRTLPILQSVDGREDDILYTADGRRIGRLDPVFKTALPLREAQIIQESLQKLRVKYVAAPGFGRSDARDLIVALQQRLGPVEVVLEPVDEVPRAANGKFRAVICAIPPAELTAAGIR
jgi:phenylacetate-CoA ligase